MNGHQHILPPSPPLSPLMTSHLARIDEWRHQVEQEGPVDSTREHVQPFTVPQSIVSSSSHWSNGKSGVYGHPHSHYGNSNIYETTKYATIAPANPALATGSQPGASASLPRPAQQVFVPPSRASDRIESQVEDEDIELSDLEADDEAANGSVTVAELRAHNRRLKRFRLTHSQTRYLMSEFARQPRPDAAHRERLSREIPGFSGRQVQVWFQNRRAKLKRLTNDDRERVLRSRALPANFDMTQALQSPFTAAKPSFPGLIQPSVQTGADPTWRRPSMNTHQHVAFVGNQPQYFDRPGYSTPPEYVVNKVNQSTPYMATPASLSSRALSPKYTTRPTPETSAMYASPPSSRTVMDSRAIHPTVNDCNVVPANAISPATGPSDPQPPRMMYPTSYQSDLESFHQGWQMGPPRPSAGNPTYNYTTMPHIHSHKQSWGSPSLPSVSRTNAVTMDHWYNPQERETMNSGREYESINFEPLYRRQQQPRYEHQPSAQNMEQNAWMKGAQEAIAVAQPTHRAIDDNYKHFSAP